MYINIIQYSVVQNGSDRVNDVAETEVCIMGRYRDGEMRKYTSTDL